MKARVLSLLLAGAVMTGLLTGSWWKKHPMEM